MYDIKIGYYIIISIIVLIVLYIIFNLFFIGKTNLCNKIENFVCNSNCYPKNYIEAFECQLQPNNLPSNCRCVPIQNYTGGNNSSDNNHNPSSGGYNPPSSGGYNPPSSGGYNPPSSGGYNPPSSGGNNPPSSGGNNPPSSGGNNPPSSGGNNTPPSGGNSSIPSDIKGYYKFSWTGGSGSGPPGTNIGVTFTGWIPGSSQGDIKPMTSAENNFLSYGGGNANGSWTPNTLKLLTSETQISKIKGLGYNGVCLDVEEGSGEPSDFDAVFKALKGAGLQVMVTTSHFAPYGFSNKAALVSDWISNPNIDILSPQLYTSGSETTNSWEGDFHQYKNCKAKLAPSIVEASMYSDVKNYLPNAVGYFQWKQV